MCGKLSNTMVMGWKMFRSEIIFIIVLSLLLIVYPDKSFFPMLLLILCCTFVYSLYKSKPKPLEWLKTTVITSVFFGVVWFLSVWLGSWGWLGLVLLVLVLVAWRIWKSWSIYNSFTKWASERLKGRTKSDYVFPPSPPKEELKGEGEL